MTDAVRDRVLDLIRQERIRQIDKYGRNEDLMLGFGSSVSAYPWLAPYSGDDSSEVEFNLRRDYEAYEAKHGKPTWMHLIREEVAELFDTRIYQHTLEEAVQVAALCVSLCEQLIYEYEGEPS